MKIKDYENYEVRPNGEVVNVKTGKILKPRKRNDGYLTVHLCKNGRYKHFYIHRSVAEAFIPNPENLPCVNHRDEDKTNNTVENLEWCFYEYNDNYGTRNERVSKSLTNGKTSKPILQLRMDGSLVRIWPSTIEVQRQLGYSQGNISNCCNGRYKQSYGFKWCYKNND